MSAKVLWNTAVHAEEDVHEKENFFLLTTQLGSFMDEPYQNGQQKAEEINDCICTETTEDVFYPVPIKWSCSAGSNNDLRCKIFFQILFGKIMDQMYHAWFKKWLIYALERLEQLKRRLYVAPGINHSSAKVQRHFWRKDVMSQDWRSHVVKVGIRKEYDHRKTPTVSLQRNLQEVRPFWALLLCNRYYLHFIQGKRRKYQLGWTVVTGEVIQWWMELKVRMAQIDAQCMARS